MKADHAKNCVIVLVACGQNLISLNYSIGEELKYKNNNLIFYLQKMENKYLFKIQKDQKKGKLILLINLKIKKYEKNQQNFKNLKRLLKSLYSQLYLWKTKKVNSKYQYQE